MSYSDLRTGGTVSPGLVYKRISENLREIQADCALMAHFYNLEYDDSHMAGHWLAASELFKQLQHKIMMMEVGRAQ